MTETLQRPDPAFINHLREIVSQDRVLTDPADCWPYGYDNSRRHSLPDVVVFPGNTQEISAITRLCRDHKVPMVCRGRGTGTTGASVPIHGGVILALERMNQILRMDPANRVMVVQPGVTNQQVQNAAAEHGFFWAPDPTSAAFCSVGGNLAYNSAGPRAVKYGTPRENVLGLEIVTGSGDIIRTGVYTTKGVVGYDLTRLVIGSEGTLATITEATLKLTALPETKRTLQASYRDIHSAAAAVSSIMAQAITPCALEFIDQKAIEMIRSYSSAALPEQAGALLMIEVDGPYAGINEAAQAVSEAAHNSGLIDLILAETPQQVEALWKTRKALSPALRTIAPKKINEDVVVPVSHMAEFIDALSQLASQHDITIVNFGHAGNGNIHVNLLINPDDTEEMHRAETCLDDVFSLVLRLNGTLSGEHGVGLEKQRFVAREISEQSLSLMHQIKQVFDPAGIMNPGKMLP